MDALTLLTFGSAVITTISYLAVVAVLLNKLRDYYPMIWDRLGRPTLIINNSIGNSGRVAKFVLFREYVSLEQGQIQAWGKVAFFLFIAAVCSSIFLTVEIATNL